MSNMPTNLIARCVISKLPGDRYSRLNSSKTDTPVFYQNENGICVLWNDSSRLGKSILIGL